MDPKKFSYKGNEKFLLAFKKLLKVKTNLKIQAVIGLHGHHTKEFQSLVTELGFRSAHRIHKSSSKINYMLT